MPLDPPIRPMLAVARDELPRDAALPGGLAYEQKADGYRALLFAGPGRAHLQSRNGSDLTLAFPDLAAAARALPEAMVLDGECVIASGGRLDFSALQSRARRRGAGARAAAVEHPAHLVVFDVLELAGRSLLSEPYHSRRDTLVSLFERGALAGRFSLCPATTDRDTALAWLAPAWGAVGIEGVVVKGLVQPYQPGRRGWVKVRTRTTTEAIVGSVTGGVQAPSTLLLGRWDSAGRLHYVARTTPLAQAARQEVGAFLRVAGPEHSWARRRFTAGWGSRQLLEHQPVEPLVVVEFAADTSVDAGRYRHPVRHLRVRDDLGLDELPRFGG